MKGQVVQNIRRGVALPIPAPGNRTLWTYLHRQNLMNPRTNESFMEGDLLMNSRYLGYPLSVKSMAFLPSLLGFLMFGVSSHKWRPRGHVSHREVTGNLTLASCDVPISSYTNAGAHLPVWSVPSQNGRHSGGSLAPSAAVLPFQLEARGPHGYPWSCHGPPHGSPGCLLGQALWRSLHPQAATISHVQGRPPLSLSP